jgi:uncharacterized membrane protein YesL
MTWPTYMLALKIFWRRMGLLLVANVLWVAMTLLVVTWPAATAGLFYLVRRVADEELLADPHSATIADFWRGFREQWRRSTLLSVGNLAVLGVLLVSLRFYGEGTIEALSWLVGPISLCLVVWAGTQLFLYPLLLHRIEQSPVAIAREAFLMTISYPLTTALTLLTVLILLAAAVILAGPILFIFFSLIAVLQTVGLRAILAQRGEMALQLSVEQREARRGRPGGSA